MTRHYVGFTSRGPTTFRNVRKAPTGEILVHLDEDEVKILKLNFADWLETGETISSVSATAYNCTCSTSTSSPNISLTLSAATAYDITGKVTLVVTASTGEKWRGNIRVRRTARYGDEESTSDYA
jgi:pyocin large subunit-like protein